MSNQERQPETEAIHQDKPSSEPAPAPETREGKLNLAVRQLLDAFERCAGDPPDCPFCGPAREFALGLLQPVDQQEPQPEAEQERLILSGRVGTDPSFRTTPRGTLVGRFSLAVHGENDSTTWFPVFAFNQRAELLKGVVTKGAAVNVVGYLHKRASKTRDGEPRTIEEIYAVTVTPRGGRS